MKTLVAEVMRTVRGTSWQKDVGSADTPQIR